MKIKIDTKLKALGEPINDAEGVAWTLKTAATAALLLPDAEGVLSGPDKRVMGALANKIHKAKKEVDVTIDEIKLLKEALGRIPYPAIVNAATELLEK